MTKLLIEIPNLNDARLLLDFAQRLNAVVIRVEDKENISPFYWLEQKGNLFGRLFNSRDCNTKR
jgi:hypothetical protein